MIINNENKKLSQNRKKIDRKNGLDDEMKLLSDKIKSEKKMKNETSE